MIEIGTNLLELLNNTLTAVLVLALLWFLNEMAKRL